MTKPFHICCALIVLSAGSLLASENEETTEVAVAALKKKQNALHPETPPPAPPVTWLPSEPCPDHWRFSGGFLYLLPTLDDTYFALSSGITTTFPNGERENNDFGFSPAFRVGAEYAFCDTHRDLQAFYSHLSTRQSRTVSGSHLWGTLGRADLISAFENYAGTASSTLNLLYHRLDVNLSQQALNCYGMYFYIQPGTEYAYLRLDENYSYQITGSTGGTIDQQSRTWGFGPQIGLAIDYNFFQRALTCSTTQTLSVTSLYSGSLLMGRARTTNSQTLATTTLLDTTDEHTWRVIPALHARVGLDYIIQGSCVGGSIGVGYEFNSYIRALARTVFPDDVADSLCETEYYNFDIQGLSIMATLSF
jgi:hypothetical protein